jgi:simple sugar transport system permease protein
MTVSSSKAAEPVASGRPFLGRLIRRPELGAAIVFVIVYSFFTALSHNQNFMTWQGTAAWLGAAAELAVVAIPVALLLIAGEFDLSIGSIVGASSIIIALSVTVFAIPLWLAVLAALIFGALVGGFNGYVVVRTKLPSFIVTLATSFIVLGATLGISTAIAGTSTISMTAEGWIRTALSADWNNFQAVILWASFIGIVAWWVLAMTKFGPWIYATGGNRDVARAAGVSVDGVKIALFIAVGFFAAFIGAIQTMEFNGGNAANGQGYTFQAPIVAVIGGVLLSGGYGTVIGVVLGTCIYAVISLGVFYTGWNTDYIQLFLGVLLLIAVFANSALRRLALSR